MSKYGSGRVVSSTPSPSQSTRAVLESAFGRAMAENMDIPEEQEVTAAPTQPTPSLPTGFTNESMETLTPLNQRMEQANEGTLDPRFDSWEKTGASVLPDNRMNTTPVEASPKFTTNDPTHNMLWRADIMTSNLDKNSKNNFTVNMYPPTGVKDAFVQLNQRIEEANSLEEKMALHRERQRLMESPDAKTDNTLPNTLNNKLLATDIQADTGYTSINPDFAKIVSMSVENVLDDGFMGANKDENSSEGWTEEEDGTLVTPVDQLNPADLTLRAGKEIQKWWDAELQGKGQKTQPMNEQELRDVGAFGLMTYVGSFPKMFDVQKDGGMRFGLTSVGKSELEANRDLRNRMFGVRIHPLSEPSGKGLKGAAGREKPALRKEGQLKSKGGNLDLLNESIMNQNGVAHVVDDRRARIGMVMALPALFSPIDSPFAKFADAFGVGPVALKTSVEEHKSVRGMDDQSALDAAVKVMSLKKKDLAREVKTITDHGVGSKYVTYGAQPLTTRTMVQQSDFNPTRNKFVRAVTRSKHPAMIRGMEGRLYDNYMNIMALSFGEDSLLPAGRLKDLNDNKDKYLGWGRQLRDALDKSLPKDVFESISTGIRTNQPTSPEAVRPMVDFQRSLSPDLLEFLQKKGEDAIMAADALIDFANFDDNMKAGRPHVTHVNAYVDGKTNGIANQGAMLGIEKLGKMVGMLRGSLRAALDGGDVRDAMADIISKRIDNGDIPVVSQEKLGIHSQTFADVLRKLGTAKPINKAVSMVFPYGKEITGMGGEIESKLPELVANDPELDIMLQQLEAAGISRKMVVDAAQDNVVFALLDIFGDKTFRTRSIMRNVGFLHGIIDEPFSIKGPTGHRMYLGGDRYDTSKAVQTSVSVRNTKQPNLTSMTTQVSPSYPSAGANRPSERDIRGEAGGYVRGRSAVIPTQSMDAAVVIRTSTGDSWNKLKDAHPAGDPYFFQIYDAFKVDVHNYDVLVDEINQNWLDVTTRDWNFLDEAENELVQLERKAADKLLANPNQKFSLEDGGSLQYLGRLMDPEPRQTQKGDTENYRGVAKSFAQSVFPIEVHGDFDGLKARKGENLRRLKPNDMLNQYDTFIKSKAKLLQSEIISAVNRVGKRRLEAGQVPTELSGEEAYAAFKAVIDFAQAKGKLRDLNREVRNDRASLRDKVMRQKAETSYGALQYWAH